MFVKPRLDAYKEVSQLRAIFAEHTAIVEPLSPDEAYLDVTEGLGAWSTGRRGLAQLRQHRRAGVNGEARSRVRGFPDHHPQSIARRADFGPLDACIHQRGVARGSVFDAERSSSHRRVALFAVRRCRRHRSANDFTVESRPHRRPVPRNGSIVMCDSLARTAAQRDQP
jgi:hypothetical protein